MGESVGSFRIGTSGYQYSHWRDVFYPARLPKRRWFEYYARHFGTVEINNTFYNLPETDTFRQWREAAPEDFCYALKFSRYGTHVKRLKDPGEPVRRFLERAELLGDKLGPILVQLPPKWSVNPRRLAAFLAVIPRRYRCTVEVRDASWLCEEVYAVLAEHNAALCIHDMIPDHPRVLTADFVYLRFHGDHYRGSYTHQALTAQARKVQDYLGRGMDVYAYFNNDEKGYAVRNAAALRRYVGR